MINRQLKTKLIRLLQTHPAVVLTGPRQVGKTTLAFEISRNKNALYLDLERPRDLVKLSDIETILTALPSHASFGFYRTTGGAEVDLVIEFGSQERWSVEVKLGKAPTVSKGFHIACDDLKPFRKIVVYSGEESFPMASGVVVHSLTAMLEIIRSLEIASGVS